MKLDFFFKRQDPGSSDWAHREPSLDDSGDRTSRPAPFDTPAEKTTSPLALPPPRGSGRQMSPRQMAEWAHEMYVSGALSWEEYLTTGFHPELHPAYNQTVGALTGKLAAPDRPRDMVREWEERLAFFHRHNPSVNPLIQRAEKILSLLRSPAASFPTRRL